MKFRLYAFQKDVMKSRNRELVGLFDSGLGIHHAGMLRSDRGLTERLFSDGLLKVKCFQLLFLYCSFLNLNSVHLMYKMCFRCLSARQLWHGE